MSTSEWLEWLQEVKGALTQEGFRDTSFQTIKPGQVFGLVRKLNEVWEMHVRGFVDGRLESEIEVSRDYIEHLNDNHRRDATPELRQILDTHHIPYHFPGIRSQMESILSLPRQVTPWKPVLVAILGLLGLFILATLPFPVL